MVPLAPVAAAPSIDRPHLTLTREQLSTWGEAWGRAARAPCIVALEGELGAGKTTLAQAICRGYGVPDPVTSPTFALVHQYDAPRSPVFHIDLYRLGGPADLTNLAWDDIVNSASLVLVEWPDRAGVRLPGGTRRVRLAYVAADDALRTLEVD